MKLTQELLHSLILEELSKDSFFVSRKNVIDLLNKRNLGRDEERRLEVISDYYEESPEEVEKLFSFLSEVGRDIIKKTISIPYVDIDDIKERLLTSSQTFERYGDNDKEGFYPFSIYVSASPEDKNTVGLEVFSNGTFKMFEGNDEASEDTIELVNELTGASREKVRIYGNHSSEVVERIRETGTLPKNLYVSPSREHAAGYWGEERVLFSAVIGKGGVSQESEVDWKTIKDVKIEKFKYV
jgi:hypothetical protein